MAKPSTETLQHWFEAAIILLSAAAALEVLGYAVLKIPHKLMGLAAPRQRWEGSLRVEQRQPGYFSSVLKPRLLLGVTPNVKCHLQENGGSGRSCLHGVRSIAPPALFEKTLLRSSVSCQAHQGSTRGDTPCVGKRRERLASPRSLCSTWAGLPVPDVWGLYWDRI